jgi:hypothetical protein
MKNNLEGKRHFEDMKDIHVSALNVSFGFQVSQDLFACLLNLTGATNHRVFVGPRMGESV